MSAIFKQGTVGIIFLLVPLEGSIEGLSPAAVDSGELSGHGERLLVEFTEVLTDVSIL